LDWTDRVSGKVAKVPIQHDLTLIENTKHISDWLKDYNQKYDMRYIAMYHATSNNAPILDEGILAGNSRRKNFGMSESGYVYLASTPQMAASFGSMSNVANLQILHALALLTLSVVLTILGGWIPSKMAASKDAVEALRS